MKLTRFEFGDVGFFHATDLIRESPDLSDEDRADLEWTEKEFLDCLEEPPVLSLEKDNPRDWYCFFTPEGMGRFKDCLDVLWNLFYNLEEAGFGDIVEINVDSSSFKVVWQDEYQAVVNVPKDTITALRKKQMAGAITG